MHVTHTDFACFAASSSTTITNLTLQHSASTYTHVDTNPGPMYTGQTKSANTRNIIIPHKFECRSQ